MRLQFRGIIYERPDLALDVREGEVGGLYRGKPWKVHHPKEKYRRNHAKSDFTYRGIHYTKD
ncbi:DUF4278 domain-containing protein [Pleurocapsales cyanobacterium LEGE 10410]|nr:DUF4278 domain-containing protein [Pleurocapsales cyanobacterium LEGE 10410]